MALEVKNRDARQSAEMSMVSLTFMQTLIRKDLSSIGEDSSIRNEALRDGFERTYIDPHGYVPKIVNRITQYMTDYETACPETCFAPYTSLVTSSMMGKSRLMKEITHHLPLVYMCLRESNSTGYPLATPHLLRWFKEGAYGSLDLYQVPIDITTDSTHLIPTLRHSLFLLHLFKNLDDLIRTETNSKSLGLNLGQNNFEWMWEFFADDLKFENQRDWFWKKVIKDTTTAFQNLRKKSIEETQHGQQYEGASRTGSTSTPRLRSKLDWARNYLHEDFGIDFRHVYTNLMQTLVGLYPISLDKLTLMVCFDEARHLRNTSSIRQKEEIEFAADGFYDEATDTPIYSNLRAMRRALSYLRSKDAAPPRVFGLFTDTTLRITNFERRWKDDTSGWDIEPRPLPVPKQFDPIYFFTSIDAHARIIDNNYAISDHGQVAKVERLLKFGRAGWYSLHSAKAKSSPNRRWFNKITILNLAISKLLGGISNIVNLKRQLIPTTNMQWTPKTHLCLLATLAVRLSLIIGPFYAEAGELISSHMAVLLGIDGHFLRTSYPSEPILAEASAHIMADVGWDNVLKALYYHVQNGIVNPSYRGELLSKVLCLMAMDDSPKPFPSKNEDAHWKRTQPVKVRDFLDCLVAAPKGRESFSHALFSNHLYTDQKELERFLNGYVFFNHFVQVEHTLSLRMLVFAWNRGAAIMCKGNTLAFDHVMPVMLAAEEGTPTFGPLFEEWSEVDVKQACSNVSFILINSRSYTILTNHKDAADDCIPKRENFTDYDLFVGSDAVKLDRQVEAPTSVYLSIVQGFGPRQRQEKYVNIYPRAIDKGQRDLQCYRQIVVVLKELGPNTYQCLKESTPSGHMVTDEKSDEDERQSNNLESNNSSDDDELPEDDDKELGNGERSVATKYLRLLRATRQGYLDDVDQESLPGIKDFLPGVYIGASDKMSDEDWVKVKKAM